MHKLYFRCNQIGYIIIVDDGNRNHCLTRKAAAKSLTAATSPRSAFFNLKKNWNIALKKRKNILESEYIKIIFFRYAIPLIRGSLVWRLSIIISF